jgi:transposase
VDEAGAVFLAKRLRRSQMIPFFRKLARCVIGMEACASSHHWARELGALGHEVRIMPAAYVKPYVKRSKNDAADAAAICEAVTRPTMRFVAVKSREQQSLLMVHRSRSLLIRRRTMLVNAIRAHLGELGIVAPIGRRGLKALLAVISGAEDARLPSLARSCLESLAAALMTVEQEIASAERQILMWHRSNEASRRLASIPGIGPIIATALIASVADPSIFRSGREMATWIGLVPK